MNETEKDKDILKKPFGIGSGILYGIGCGVGGSIFILLGPGIELAGPGVLISLILGFILILITALNYSELEISLPISGGAYNFTKEGMGGFLAFIIGFFLWFANVASCTFSALTFSFVFDSMFPILSNFMIPLAIIPIVFIASVFFRTNRVSNKVLIALTIVLVIIFTFFFFSGFLLSPITNPEGFEPEFYQSKINSFGVIQMFATLFIFFTSITSNLAYFNPELKNPSKNIPKVNILAIIFTFIIYIGVTSAVLINLGNLTEDLSEYDILLARISYHILGPIGFYLMGFAAIIATLIAMNAALGSAVSIFNALARDHYVPKIFSKIDEKTKVPTYSLLLTTAICIILTLFTNIGFAAETTTFIYFFGLAFVNFAAVSLRYKRKQLDRPFKAPFFPYLPIGVGIICLILSFILSLNAVLFGLLFFTIGMTYYLITIAERSSIILTLAGIKFFMTLLVGIFIWILNNLSMVSSPIIGFELYFSIIFLRFVIFVCLVSFITIFFDLIPLTQIVYTFIKKVNKDKVAINVGGAQIIELKVYERKIIYYINLLLGVIEIICMAILIIVITILATGMVSIVQIDLGGSLLFEETSEYIFLSSLTILALFLGLSGTVSLYLNREIKKIGI